MLQQNGVYKELGHTMPKREIKKKEKKKEGIKEIGENKLYKNAILWMLFILCIKCNKSSVGVRICYHVAKLCYGQGVRNEIA